MEIPELYMHMNLAYSNDVVFIEFDYSQVKIKAQ